MNSINWFYVHWEPKLILYSIFVKASQYITFVCKKVFQQLLCRHFVVFEFTILTACTGTLNYF